MTTLRLEHLTITTPDGTPIVNDVTWDVSSGQRLGLIGASGSGKSMTGKAIMGMLPAGLTATGHLWLDDVDLLTLPEKQLVPIRGRRIAFIPQEPGAALDPLMPVGRQIEGVIRLHTGASRAEARRQVTSLLEQVRIPDAERVARSYPWQLSGGQRQRVCVAQVLACSPDVIIADEPTTALDVTVQAAIVSLLDELVASSGTALIFISHDLPVVASLCPRLVVMDGGRIVDETSTEALRGAAGDGAAINPVTRALMDAARATAPHTAAAPEVSERGEARDGVGHHGGAASTAEYPVGRTDA